MGAHSLGSTQSRYPWRATVRTVFAALVALAAMAGPIYSAITGGSPEAATGWAAVMLAVTGAVTRVLALPQVDEWLHRFVPWLATGAGYDEWPDGGRVNEPENRSRTEFFQQGYSLKESEGENHE